MIQEIIDEAVKLKDTSTVVLFEGKLRDMITELVESVPIDKMSGGGNYRRVLMQWKDKQLGREK